MKKLFSALLALSFLAVLAGCTQNDAASTPPAESTPPAPSAAEPSEVSAPLPAAPSEVIEEAAEVSAGDLGDYHIDILDFVLTSTYEGEPAIIINLEYTNNSAEGKAFMFAVSCKAYQDGVQLPSAIILNTEIYDSQQLMLEVRDGATISIGNAFALNSETSPVVVEVTPLLGSTPKLSRTFEIA